MRTSTPPAGALATRPRITVGLTLQAKQDGNAATAVSGQHRPDAVRPRRRDRHRPAPDRAHRPAPEHDQLRAQLPRDRRLRSAGLPVAADAGARRRLGAPASVAGAGRRRAQEGRAPDAARRPAAAVDQPHRHAGPERIAGPRGVVAVGAFAGRVDGQRRHAADAGEPGRRCANAVDRDAASAGAQYLAARLPAAPHAAHRLRRLRRAGHRRRPPARPRPAGRGRHARSRVVGAGRERHRAARVLLVDLLDRVRWATSRRWHDACARPRNMAATQRCSHNCVTSANGRCMSTATTCCSTDRRPARPSSKARWCRWGSRPKRATRSTPASSRRS